MKVGIDITSLLYNRGVSRYTSNLVRALQSQPQVELSLYGSSLRQGAQLQAAAQRLGRTQRIVIQRFGPSLQNIIWNRLHLNPISRVLPGIDVFHSWDWVQPPDTRLPLVSTIHDLAILKFPETAHPQVVKLHQQAWQRLKDSRAHVIAVSRSTKKDVIDLLGFDPSRVHVVYEALPTEMQKVSEQLSDETYQHLKTKLNLAQPYILFVGTREPRKNLKRLIEAWLPMADEIQLVIAGEAGWDETSSKLNQAMRHPQLRFLGRVSDQELAVLYSEAAVFAYPCLYEGFGLPILEAFYYGTPVVTANVSSMVEVAGNAAELVDPLSVSDITRGLQAVLNESLTSQQQRMQKMVIRLQMFDWQRVAKETVAVYQAAIQERAA